MRGILRVHIVLLCLVGFCAPRFTKNGPNNDKFIRFLSASAVVDAVPLSATSRQCSSTAVRLHAARLVDRSQIILKVPVSSCLEPSMLEQLLPAAIGRVSKQVPQLDEEDRLSLLLVYCKQLGPACPFESMLSVLPQLEKPQSARAHEQFGWQDPSMQRQVQSGTRGGLKRMQAARKLIPAIYEQALDIRARLGVASLALAARLNASRHVADPDSAPDLLQTMLLGAALKLLDWSDLTSHDSAPNGSAALTDRLPAFSASTGDSSFLWGLQSASRRALHIRGRRLMAPGPDLLGHCPTPAGKPRSSGEAYLKYHQIVEEEGAGGAGAPPSVKKLCSASTSTSTGDGTGAGAGAAGSVSSSQGRRGALTSIAPGVMLKQLVKGVSPHRSKALGGGTSGGTAGVRRRGRQRPSRAGASSSNRQRDSDSSADVSEGGSEGIGSGRTKRPDCRTMSVAALLSDRASIWLRNNISTLSHVMVSRVGVRHAGAGARDSLDAVLNVFGCEPPPLTDELALALTDLAWLISPNTGSSAAVERTDIDAQGTSAVRKESVQGQHHGSDSVEGERFGVDLLPGLRCAALEAVKAVYPRVEKASRIEGEHTIFREVLVVRADRSFEAGDELCEDYGDQSDYEFGANHDFLPGLLENPSDCVRVGVPPVTSAPTSAEERMLAEASQRSDSVAGAQAWLRGWTIQLAQRQEGVVVGRRGSVTPLCKVCPQGLADVTRQVSAGCKAGSGTDSGAWCSVLPDLAMGTQGVGSSSSSYSPALAVLESMPERFRHSLVATLPSSPPWQRYSEVVQALRMQHGSEPCVRPGQGGEDDAQDALSAALAVRLMGDSETALCHQALGATRELVQLASAAAEGAGKAVSGEVIRAASLAGQAVVAQVCIDDVYGRDSTGEALPLERLQQAWNREGQSASSQWEVVKAKVAELESLRGMSSSRQLLPMRRARRSVELAILAMARLREFPTDLEEDMLVQEQLEQCERLLAEATGTVLGGILASAAGGSSEALLLAGTHCPASIDVARRALRFRVGRKLHLVRLLRDGMETAVSALAGGFLGDTLSEVIRPGSPIWEELRVASSALTRMELMAGLSTNARQLRETFILDDSTSSSRGRSENQPSDSAIGKAETLPAKLMRLEHLSSAGLLDRTVRRTNGLLAAKGSSIRTGFRVTTAPGGGSVLLVAGQGLRWICNDHQKKYGLNPRDPSRSCSLTIARFSDEALLSLDSMREVLAATGVDDGGHINDHQNGGSSLYGGLVHRGEAVDHLAMAGGLGPGSSQIMSHGAAFNLASAPDVDRAAQHCQQLPLGVAKAASRDARSFTGQQIDQDSAEWTVSPQAWKHRLSRLGQVCPDGRLICESNVDLASSLEFPGFIPVVVSGNKDDSSGRMHSSCNGTMSALLPRPQWGIAGVVTLTNFILSAMLAAGDGATSQPDLTDGYQLVSSLAALDALSRMKMNPSWKRCHTTLADVCGGGEIDRSGEQEHPEVRLKQQVASLLHEAGFGTPRRVLDAMAAECAWLNRGEWRSGQSLIHDNGVDHDTDRDSWSDNPSTNGSSNATRDVNQWDKVPVLAAAAAALVALDAATTPLAAELAYVPLVSFLWQDATGGVRDRCSPMPAGFFLKEEGVIESNGTSVSVGRRSDLVLSFDSVVPRLSEAGSRAIVLQGEDLRSAIESSGSLEGRRDAGEGWQRQLGKMIGGVFGVLGLGAATDSQRTAALGNIWSQGGRLSSLQVSIPADALSSISLVAERAMGSLAGELRYESAKEVEALAEAAETRHAPVWDALSLVRGLARVQSSSLAQLCLAHALGEIDVPQSMLPARGNLGGPEICWAMFASGGGSGAASQHVRCVSCWFQPRHTVLQFEASLEVEL